MRLRHSFDDKIQFKNTDFQHYTKVCEVKKDAGLVCDGDSWMLRDLEDVFAVLNGRYYDEDTSTDIVHEAHVSGYKMKTITRKDGEVVQGYMSPSEVLKLMVHAESLPIYDELAAFVSGQNPQEEKEGSFYGYKEKNDNFVPGLDD